MTVTLKEIRDELNSRRFPAFLVAVDDDLSVIVASAMRELNRYMPVSKVASFTTAENVQDYHPFDPEDEVTGGVLANASHLIDVLWNPSGDWSSLNIFSPGWMMLSQTIIFTGNFFHQPSQMMVIRQKLAEWKKQFGSQGWDIIGTVGEPDAILRLYPVPRDATKVVIHFSAEITLSTMPESYKDHLMQWVEYYTAEAAANFYAQGAGVNLLGFGNSSQAMDYWDKKARRYHEHAVTIQGGIGGEVERS